MVKFKAITEENFDDIIRMKRPEEEHYVAPNSVSLAQAWLYRENNDVFPFAIYEDETAVGFMMLEEDREDRCLILWRIMFPEEHVNQGFGTQAVQLLLELARESGKYDYITLDCAPSNQIARHVYEKIGFRPTGEISHGDVVMRLDF